MTERRASTARGADAAPADAGRSGSRISVRVRLFARQRELAGTREVRVELRAGATIEDGWQAVVERFPALEPGRPYMRFARNGEYAEPSTALADGDELACIPPVSGGAERADGDGAEPVHRLGAERSKGPSDRASGAQASRILEIRDRPFGNEILAELTERLALPEDGAVVGFLGLTRVSPGTPAPGQEEEAAHHAGRRVQLLEYEAHETMALRVLGQICDEIQARFDVRRVAIVHRTGAVPLGEASIAILVCSPHRDQAFDAARYVIDETKARAPIWKAEHFEDGHVWIGEPAREGPRDAAGKATPG